LNENLHRTINDDGVRTVNVDTSDILVAKTTRFPHRKIHKYTLTSADGKTHDQIDHVFIDRRRQTSIIDIRPFIGAGCYTDFYLVVAELR
jgi:hypothetical protein